MVTESITCLTSSRWSKDYLDIRCSNVVSTLSITTEGTPTTTSRPKSCDCQCGVAGDTSSIEIPQRIRVVGGQTAIKGAWPWQVVVLMKQDSGNEVGRV